MVKYY